MKKKIIFFLMALFLTICGRQTAFAQIYAYLYDNSYFTSSVPGGFCNFEIDLFWNISPGLLNNIKNVNGSCVAGRTGDDPLFQECGYLGETVVLASGSGTPCTQAGLQNWRQTWDPIVNSSQYQTTLIYSTNDSPVTVNSNIAQLVNPINAPIGSPVNSPPVYGAYTAAILASQGTFTKDPVNIATGEDYFSSTDFSLNGRGPKLALSRKYRSFSTINGMFGYGWRTDYDADLTTDSSGNVVIYNGEGTGIYFMNNSGTYTNSPGNYSTIIKNPDSTYTMADKNGIVTHYDLNGRLVSHTDRNGNTLTFVYNPAQVGSTYIQDASGRQIKLYFDSNNHVISSQDPSGRVYQYGYDVNGNLVSVTDPTGAVTNYNYDSNHKIIQFTNSNGNKTYYQYDTQGRAVANWQDNNVNKVTLSYQADNTTVVTDSLGNNNTYVFNSYGLLISHTDPLGALTQQTWDPLMNRTSLTDARSNTTSFGYDFNGNIAQIADPLGNQTNMSYTSNFNLIGSKTDALGNMTNYVYDIKGNLTAVIDALGKNHDFTYDQYGNAITATDTLGNTTNFNYDSFSHVIQNTDVLGNITSFTYDAGGNILTQTDARNHPTSFQYDNLNRLIKTTFAQ